MKKVFAVFIFLSLLPGCTKLQNLYYTKNSLYLRENIIYSTPGDFDGDNRKEYLTIVKEDNKSPKLKVKDGRKVYCTELNIDESNLNPLVSDVNSDNRDDIIICDSENGVVNMFVYTFSNGINTVFSPETIKNIISFERIKDGYLVSGGPIEKFIKSTDNLDLKFYLSELENTNNVPTILSEGMVSSKDGKVLSIVSVQFNINSKGQTLIKDIQIKPYNEVSVDY